MNKNEFIDTFLQNADFLTDDELESAKLYLNTRLEDDKEFGDPAVFADNMRLSFELLKYLEDVENERHISALGDSISRAMDAQADSDAPFEAPIEAIPEPIHEQKPEQKQNAEPIKKPRKGGLINKLRTQKGYMGIICMIVAAIVGVLLLPAICAVAAVCAALYVIPTVLVFAVWLAVLAFIAAFALLGIIAMSYGIANIFITAPIGLMEIGLGTALFSVMLALWALDFQFITSTMPFVCSKITLLLKLAFKKPKVFLFGKRAV